MPTSLARTLANRANARKSTGPRTQEGKDASRWNAWKHGLAAEELSASGPDRESDPVADRFAELAPRLEPRDPWETWLVEQIAVEAVRIDRCQAQETLLRSRLALRATLLWDEDREFLAVELGERLSRAPQVVAPKLLRTKQGCAWMIERWEFLGQALEEEGDWDDAQKSRALDLLGMPPDERGGVTPIDGDAPTRKAFVAARLDRLLTLQVKALDALDDRERSEAVEGLGPDIDRDLLLTTRYRAVVQAAARLGVPAAGGGAPDGRGPPRHRPDRGRTGTRAGPRRRGGSRASAAAMPPDFDPFPDTPAEVRRRPVQVVGPGGNRHTRRAREAMAKRKR